MTLTGTLLGKGDQAWKPGTANPHGPCRAGDGSLQYKWSSSNSDPGTHLFGISVDGIGTEIQIGFRKIADSPKAEGRNFVTLRNSICRESPVKGAGSSDTGNKERKGREEPAPHKSLM